VEDEDMNDSLDIGGHEFQSRLFLGTGKFGSNQIMHDAVVASESELVTVALRRVHLQEQEDEVISHLNIPNVNLLPNTSGVRTAKEAVLSAQLARESLQTNLLKLEIHPDPRYLLPDPIETLKATEILAKDDFIILPYINADPVLCKRLEDVGAAAVMPLGAPIGTNQGLQTKAMLEIIIEQSNVPVVVDAGIGAPSHAAEAMEMGADAVLVNTAIAIAGDPVTMSEAFKLATLSGRMAFQARIGAKNKQAQASSPLTAFLNPG
jgi:thiazole synthase